MEEKEWFKEFIKGNIDLRCESIEVYNTVLKACEEKNICWESGTIATKGKEYVSTICLSCKNGKLVWYIYGDSERGSYPVIDNMI